MYRLWIVLFAVFAVSPFSFARDEKDCDLHLNEVLTQLPESIPVAANKKMARAAFAEAFRSVLENAAWEPALDAIHRLAESGPEGLMDGDFRAIKSSRKRFVILRSTYLVFDSRHRLPKNFNDFVKTLGELKDLIRLKGESRYSEAAEEVLFRYNRFSLSEVNSGFRPASRESVRNFLRKYSQRMTRDLSKDELSDSRHHKLRKRVRDFVSYFKGHLQIDPNDEDVQKTVDYLFAIIDEIGDVRDSELTLNAQGHIVMMRDRFIMPGDLTGELRLFLDRVRLN